MMVGATLARLHRHTVALSYVNFGTRKGEHRRRDAGRDV